MPAWATVAITLGASGITGIVGLLSGSLQSSRERQEAWRRNLVEIADAYAIHFTEAVPKVRDGISELAAGFDDGPMRGQAGLLVDHLGKHAMRVQLYFGDESDVAVHSGRALVGLRKAVTARDPVEASKELEDAFALEQRFMRAANRAVPTPTPLAASGARRAPNAPAAAAPSTHALNASVLQLGDPSPRLTASRWARQRSTSSRVRGRTTRTPIALGVSHSDQFADHSRCYGSEVERELVAPQLPRDVRERLLFILTPLRSCLARRSDHRRRRPTPVVSSLEEWK